MELLDILDILTPYEGQPYYYPARGAVINAYIRHGAQAAETKAQEIAGEFTDYAIERRLRA